jgi:ribosomal protein S18 acetylase RimI-like enzyme
MIDPLVRAASDADVGALEALEAEARAALVDARGGRRWLEEHPLVGPSWAAAVAARRVFVATLPATPDDELAVGYLVLDVAGRVAHVDQVYVMPEARELGFGDALLAAAVDEARSAGAVVLEAHALPGDRDTKNLYERAGITARLITVSTALEPLSGPSTEASASR